MQQIPCLCCVDRRFYILSILQRFPWQKLLFLTQGSNCLVTGEGFNSNSSPFEGNKTTTPINRVPPILPNKLVKYYTRPYNFSNCSRFSNFLSKSTCSKNYFSPFLAKQQASEQGNRDTRRNKACTFQRSSVLSHNVFSSQKRQWTTPGAIHPLFPSLKLAVWQISGDSLKQQAFQQQLLTCSATALRPQPPKLTTVPGLSGVAGVRHGKVTPYLVQSWRS